MRRHLVIAAALLAPRVVDALCLERPAVPRVFTDENTEIEDGGGVMVMATGAPEGNKDAANQPSWRFVAGDRRLAPVITQLAPGLDVYRLPDSPDAMLVLETDKHERQVGIRRSSTRGAARLPMPVVESIDEVTEFPRTRSISEITTVHFPTPAPKGAVALVIYGYEDGVRRAYSFGPLREGDRDVVVYHASRCIWQPAGTKAPVAGQRAAVAWIDRSGRASEPSKPIDIVTAKALR